MSDISGASITDNTPASSGGSGVAPTKRLRRLLRRDGPSLPPYATAAVFAVIARERVKGKGAPRKSAFAGGPSAQAGAGGKTGRAGAYAADEDATPDPLRLGAGSITNEVAGSSGSGGVKQPPLPDALEDAIVHALLVGPVVGILQDALAATTQSGSIFDVASLIAEVVFDTGALWQAPKTKVWGGQGFNSVAALRVGVPAADDRAKFRILAAWSRVAFDAYFATTEPGRTPAVSPGVEPYAVADVPTRERFHRSVVAALGGPGAGGSGEAYRRPDTIFGRLQQPAVVYWRDDGSGRHSVVVALPGSTSVGDWVVSFSDEDRDADTDRSHAQLGHIASTAHGGGFSVHAGFFGLAARVLHQLSEDMSNLPGGVGSVSDVTVVGHSKGAGVGALLTACLLDLRARDGPFGADMRFVGFSTPKVISKHGGDAMAAAAARDGDCLVGLVNAYDIVPRLSRHTATRLIRNALEDKPGRGGPPDVIQAARDVAEEADCKEELSQVLQGRELSTPGSFNTRINSVGDGPELGSVGQVLFLHPSGHHAVLVPDPMPFLDDIVFTDRAFEDHRLGNYVARLDAHAANGAGAIETMPATPVPPPRRTLVQALRFGLCCCQSTGDVRTDARGDAR